MGRFYDMRQINLVSQEIVQELEQGKVKISLGGAIILLCIFIFIQLVLFSAQSRSIDKELSRISAEQQQSTSIELEAELSDVNNKVKGLIASNEQYSLFLNEDNLCTNLLNALTNITESKVWFSSLSVNRKSGSCKIQGQSYDPESVSEFVFNLNKLPFFADINLGGLEKAQSDKETVSNFDVDCILKIKGSEQNEGFIFR